MNEIFQGMRLVKLRAWEKIFEEKIRRTRDEELKMLDKDSFYWTLISKFRFLDRCKSVFRSKNNIVNCNTDHSQLDFLTHASSVLTTLFTFAAYFWLEERSLEAGNVFASLALFSQLTVPLLIFPVMIPIIINAMVSKHRVSRVFVFVLSQQTL